MLYVCVWIYFLMYLVLPFKKKILNSPLQALGSVSFFKNLCTPHKICEIQKKLEGMLEETDRRCMKKKDPHSHATSQRSHTSSFIDEGSVIGRNEDRRQIVEMLLSIEGAKLSVIPIVGMGGIGKSALAQLVYNDKDIENCFDLRIWISVSVDYDVVSITKSIVESVMEKRLNLSELDKIQVKLQNVLKEKRFLLVLDDMWNENISHNFWDVLRSPFSVGLSGSKVLVTTRSSVVSSILTITDPYHLQPLSDKDCWKLIAQKALSNKNEDKKKELEVIGEKIAEKCGGLPLAAKTIGSALCSKFAKSEWEALLENKLWDLPECKTEVFPELRLSYNYLPACLKKCFAFCSIFPHKYQFQKDELVQLWAVEGFIQSQGGKRNEDIGNDYFDNLLSRYFFFEDVNESGQQVYSMRGLIHEMAQLVSADFCIQMEDGMTHLPKFRNARHSSLLSQNIQSRTLEEFQRCRHVKTFMVFCESGLRDDKFLYVLFVNFQCLRVLNLSNTGISELPDSIENSKCLRYLNVSKTNIWKLPESIACLYGLEILKLQECPKFLQLPRDMKNLVKLRHLDLNIKQLSSMPSELGKLTNLQTLSAFIVGKYEGCQIGELENMRNLQGRICITNLENVPNVEDAKKAKLDEKPYLASLELLWNDQGDSIKKGEEVLGGLRPHCKLQALKVINYSGITFPSWLGDPSVLWKLEDIELRNCKNCKVLPTLSHLPALKSLYIEEFGLTKLEHEFCGSVNNKGFPSLEHLTFFDMPKLVSWEGITAMDMPRLGTLKISDCPKLGSLPSLHFLSSLENLDIMRCPELQSLPVEGLPISLKKLLIEESDILKERCREGGADWSKITAIQPIPTIEIDY